jgi:hypothetical protein
MPPAKSVMVLLLDDKGTSPMSPHSTEYVAMSEKGRAHLQHCFKSFMGFIWKSGGDDLRAIWYLNQRNYLTSQAEISCPSLATLVA